MGVSKPWGPQLRSILGSPCFWKVSKICVYIYIYPTHPYRVQVYICNRKCLRQLRAEVFGWALIRPHKNSYLTFLVLFRTEGE